MQVEFQLDLPDTVQVSGKEIETITVYALFERGILTSGQAADMLGVSKKYFIENASFFNVSMFQYEDGELALELDQWQ